MNFSWPKMKDLGWIDSTVGKIVAMRAADQVPSPGLHMVPGTLTQVIPEY